MKDATVNPPSLGTRSLELYKTLYTIRRAEELIIQYYPENDMKTPMHMSMGQEAIPVGVCAALRDGDQVFASYRSHATFLAKGGATDRFFAELYGRQTGTVNGKAGSMHLADPAKGHMCSSAVVATGIPVAVGAAFAHKRRGTGRLACVFFGDGAADEGAFWESLNTACVMRLPVLFVCEDNGLAVQTPAHVRQGYASLTDIISRFKCHVAAQDTTDVEAIRQTAEGAIIRMRASGQPAFLSFTCYRYLEHVGVREDFHLGYRSRDDYEAWRQRDCLTLQRARLVDAGHGEEALRSLEQDIDERLQQDVARAKVAPPPGPEELFKGVFHEKP